MAPTETDDTVDSGQKQAEKPELKAGTQVKDYGSIYEEYEVGAVVECRDESADILMMEGNQAGEIVERDLDSLEQRKPSVYIARLPGCHGMGQTKEQAIIAASEYFRADNYEGEEVKVWTAKVHQDFTNVNHHGGVHSRFIEEEDEFQLEASELEKVSNLKDNQRALIEGYEPSFDSGGMSN